MARRKRNQRLTLADLLSAILGPPQSRDGSLGDWWLCPFHNDRNPSLHTMPDERRWKCFGCGESGDAVDFVRRLNPSLTYRQASLLLAMEPVDRIAAVVGTHAIPNRSESSHRRFARKEGGSQSPEWQAIARLIVSVSARILSSSNSADANGFLTQRRLSDATIRKARLGYVDKGGTVKGLYVPSEAIVIPWFIGRQVVAINFRRLYGARRYQLLRGSTKCSLYPNSTIDPTRPVVICEGELDCLLGNQEAGDIAQFVTLGSASDRPTRATLAKLLPCSLLLLAYDADSAGDSAAADLKDALPKAVRLRPPEKSKDLGGIVVNGGDLRAWVGAAIERATRANRRKPVRSTKPTSPKRK